MRSPLFLRALPHAVGFPLMVFGIVWLSIGIVLAAKGPPPPEGVSAEALLQEIDKAKATDNNRLESVLDHRLDDYKANIDRFETNLNVQAFLIVVTILLLMRRTETLKFFGNDVPLRWLHLFVPLMLTYYWLRFGFLLDELIESRIRGVGIATKLYPPELAKSLFVDASFIDGWIMAFVDNTESNYSGLDPSFTAGTAAFLVLVLGSIAAASHACLLALVSAATRRYLDTRSSRWHYLYYSLPLLPLALILAAHFQFAYGGHNPNWLQIFIAVAAIPLMTILHWIGIRVDQVRLPMSFECLKRRRSVVHSRRAKFVNSKSSQVLENPIHVALIGDSLSTAFYVGGIPGMIRRMWRDWQPSWFASTHFEANLESIDQRLARIAPIVATQHATPTAKLDRTRVTFRDLLTRTRHFADQVDAVVTGRFPDLLLLWIGHNNMNWRENAEESLDSQARRFGELYERQLYRILTAAVAAKHHSTIIAYGLVNFESFFHARAKAEALRMRDSDLYAFLEIDYKYFESMKPEFRASMVQLAVQCNDALRSICKQSALDLDGTNTRLIYSDAMAKVDIGKPDLLSSADGWHPNIKGHGVLADAAYLPIAAILDSLRARDESD